MRRHFLMTCLFIDSRIPFTSYYSIFSFYSPALQQNEVKIHTTYIQSILHQLRDFQGMFLMTTSFDFQFVSMIKQCDITILLINHMYILRVWDSDITFPPFRELCKIFFSLPFFNFIVFILFYSTVSAHSSSFIQLKVWCLNSKLFFFK